VTALDSLGLPGDGRELVRRGIERLGRSRRLAAHFPPTAFAPLGHWSILFAARLAGLFMANIASQKKRNARTERERQENLRFRSSVKTHFKRLAAAVSSGDVDAIASEHKALISRIDKAVQKGALHRNTGARKKSRAAGLVGTASQTQG
jgi:small subunit ribosomal protein S20